MILVDANLLVCASVREMRENARAVRWLDDRLNAQVRVGLPWESLLAFVRVATSRRLFSNPLSLAVAWRQVAGWLGLRNVWTPSPGERHAEVLEGLLAAESRGSLVHDAHLAAIAIEHGLLLCSADRDFSRFSGLRWENPLEG